MLRTANENALLIGDADRRVHAAMSQASPHAHLTSAVSVFDGIAELAARSFSTVLVAVEPIERRPEEAVRTLRQLAGDARLILFGHPTLEPLSRKMLDFGCDDYVVSPPAPGELQQILGAPRLRLADAVSPQAGPADSPITQAAGAWAPPHGLPLAEVFVDAMLQHPSEPALAAVARVNELLGSSAQLLLTSPGQDAPVAGEGQAALSAALREGEQEMGHLWLLLPGTEDSSSARHFLSRLAQLVAKAMVLRDRHSKLQKLAITDDLTGVYNARYFKHALNRIIEKARVMRFPVTLLLFDIDSLKKYNDQYGHAMGDEVLKQTAALMRRCSREHDVVARIGGDEFAVVFWEKDGPRTPRDARPGSGGAPSRPPNSVLQIIGRFQKLIASQTFKGLGPTGRGVLTVSGGLSQFPYDGLTVDELIAAADRDLVFGAKQAGKNTIFLVGSGELLTGEDPRPLERPGTAGT